MQYTFETRVYPHYLSSMLAYQRIRRHIRRTSPSAAVSRFQLAGDAYLVIVVCHDTHLYLLRQVAGLWGDEGQPYDANVALCLGIEACISRSVHALGQASADDLLRLSYAQPGLLLGNGTFIKVTVDDEEDLDDDEDDFDDDEDDDDFDDED